MLQISQIKKFVPAVVAVAALGVGMTDAALAQSASSAVQTAIGAADTALGEVTSKVAAVGAIIIGLAVVGAAIKWVKGTIFS